ncbi:hypothetical protein [Sutcliffiella horikoshii]|uniref:hypothetical protein n=1 Tax=Sutcliffiella horikoshii TaxID=79883 RepID=UPI001F41B5A1|nr:hypothetical protein [Sutcliffiella horikoshii]MCG1022791.1 hypothetical protein [Sutcliffiella horikoshii]
MMMSMSLAFAVSEEMSEVFRLLTEVSAFLSKDFQKLSKVFLFLSEPQNEMSKPRFILVQTTEYLVRTFPIMHLQLSEYPSNLSEWFFSENHPQKHKNISEFSPCVPCHALKKAVHIII